MFHIYSHDLNFDASIRGKINVVPDVGQFNGKPRSENWTSVPAPLSPLLYDNLSDPLAETQFKEKCSFYGSFLHLEIIGCIG